MLDVIAPSTHHRLRFARETGLKREAAGTTLENALYRLDLKDPHPAITDALGQLMSWQNIEDLFAQTVASGGPALALQLTEVLERACDMGLLDEGLITGRSGPTIEINRQINSGLAQDVQSTWGQVPYRLALHAQMQPDAGVWTLKAPLAWGSARIHDLGLLELIGKMASEWTPRTSTEVEIARLLCKCGLLISAEAATADPPLARHEAWLHMLSRRGTAGKPVGARAGKPRAMVPPQYPGEAIPLERRDVQDLPFRQLVTQRKSWRICPVDWIEAPDLSELLQVAITGLPYPSAGDCYDIDVMVALRDTVGDLPRFARYDPGRHALIPIAGDPQHLLDDAATAMGRDGTPPGLLILSARFTRMHQNYSDAAYAQMLKNAGVMQQTLHLAATALGIGSCIIGGGNSREFAKLTGLNPVEEGPIGEVVLTGRFAASAKDAKDG